MACEPSAIIEEIAKKMSVQINVMCTTFRPRDRNPSAYDTKIKFWSDVLHSVCVDKGMGLVSRYTVDAHILPRTLVANEIYPLGLSVVLKHLADQGLISNATDYLNPSSSPFLKFSHFNISGLISSALLRPFSSMGLWYPSIHTDSSTQGITHGILIFHERVQNDIELIYAAVHNITCLTDSIMHKDDLLRLAGLDMLIQKHKVGSNSTSDADILLRAAEKQGFLAHDPKSGLVKFAWGTTAHQTSSSSVVENLDIGPVDHQIFSVKRTAKMVSSRMAAIETQIDSIQDQARIHARNNKKEAAKRCLVKRKNMELTRDKLSSTLDTLLAMVLQIDAADSQTAIVSSLQSGSAALKSILTNPMLQLDTINSTMDGVMDTFAEYRDIEDTISTNMTVMQNESGIAGMDDNDAFEAELAALIDADVAVPIPAAKVLARSSSHVSTSPLASLTVNENSSTNLLTVLETDQPARKKLRTEAPDISESNQVQLILAE